MNKTLVLIDIQNDYFPGGKMELSGSEEAANQAKRLLSTFREAKAPIVHVQHISARPEATFFLPDTPGAEIHASVAPAAGEIVIRKHFPNAFRETSLLEELKALSVDDLVIAGMMTHMCVDSTTRAAFDLGFNLTVIGDACATRDLDFAEKTIPAVQVHAAFLAALNAVFAAVKDTQTYLSAME